MAYKSMRGKLIDMGKLMGSHELTPAVGNMRVNARGDQLGTGGKIVKKREEIVAEYYQTNPKARVQSVPKTVVPKEVIAEPTPVPAPPKKTAIQPEKPTTGE